MTIIEEIISIANTLADQGKQPSVALIKSRLSQPAPLPTLIKVLKSWQHDPKGAALADDTAQEQQSLSQQELLRAMLKEELAPLQQEIAMLKQQLNELKHKP